MTFLGLRPFPDVFVIRSHPDNKVLTCSHQNKSYAIGFISNNHAERVRKNVCTKSKLELLDYNENSFGILSIEKKIDINKSPCYIQSKDFSDFISYPIHKQLGVMFAFRVLLETENKILLETQVFEPRQNIKSFKKYLEDQMQ